MKTVAVIPVKDKSERVQNKNFKEFIDGVSLMELKIKHLKNANIFDKIYVSTDSKQAIKLAEKYDLIFIERDVKYCNNITPWSDVIYEVVRSIPEHEDTLLAWCHTTSPLFQNYKGSIETYRTLDPLVYNGLIAVAPLSEYIISQKAKPINYHWGVWHEYSQNLDRLYTITGALFVAPIKEMLQSRYVVSSRPYLFEVSAFEAIDLDTEYEFQLARLMERHKDQLIHA